MFFCFVDDSFSLYKMPHLLYYIARSILLDGTWVQSGRESAIFDKGYYDELIRRAWRPQFRNGSQHDWTWGGQNRDVFMLNADICLQFDISSPNCCTDSRGNCRNTFQDVQCPRSTVKEVEVKSERWFLVLFSGPMLHSQIQTPV